ncbi:MAG: ankyrin repeat domain-containing protein [Bryobacterales bacterium]|nr:ankyrin repeat domain-containing protein [Bryobacterales bacterium]
MLRAYLGLVVWMACPGAFAQSDSFYQVIRHDDLAALAELLKTHGPRIRDARGNTPMMYAAAVGSVDAMRMLVRAGVPADAANDFGATPLMWSAGQPPKVRYLLDQGASVKTKARSGRTPLLIAASYDGSIEIARLMIAKGADVNATERTGATVLQAAAYANNIDVVRLLIEKGARANTKDGAGFTPLSMAASNGARSGPLVALLIEQGLPVDARCVDSLEMMKNGPLGLGRLTALMFASMQSNYSAVESLVKAGANVNATDIRGMTPLMLAVATDRADPRIVRLLLGTGADPKIRSEAGETALDWARKYRNPAILEALGITVGPLEEPPLPAGPATVTSVIERSVALLQTTSRQFLAKGGCPACHAQHHTGMAVAAAMGGGYKVNREWERAERRATAAFRGSLEQNLFQVIDPPPGTDGHAFSLLQMNAADSPPRLANDSVAFHLAAMQRREGDWPAYGPVRPPMEDGSFPITAKAIRALRDHMPPGRKADFEERIERAAAWLATEPPLTTEDRAMQLLGLRWAGKPAPRNRVDELVKLQRANGGWAQTPYLPTDAYATGVALYALQEAGVVPSSATYRRGVSFLILSRKDDGSWHVRTRAAGFQPYFESGFPHGHDQWISQSGTAWAVIALSHALPPL